LDLQQNKTDRNDARGIAHMMRVGLFKDVHVKTLTSQKRRALLTARSLLQEKAIDLENEMRGLLRNFGLKVGQTAGGTFERRIFELVEHDSELAEIMEPLLAGRRKLREGLAKLGKRVRGEARRCLPATDDGAWSRTNRLPRLCIDSRYSQPVPSFAIGGSRPGSHTRTQSVRRGESGRPCLSPWGCYDEKAALRGCPVDDDACGKMVLAQGMGDEHCQAARREEGQRCLGA
jgi:hypothetical protein